MEFIACTGWFFEHFRAVLMHLVAQFVIGLSQTQYAVGVMDGYVVTIALVISMLSNCSFCLFSLSCATGDSANDEICGQTPDVVVSITSDPLFSNLGFL